MRWIETSLNFKSSLHGALPVFEATIRVLGGLLGAYAIDPRPVFLQKAREIGDALFCAISTVCFCCCCAMILKVCQAPNVFSHPTSMWRECRGSGPQIVFAELATLQMEFVYLSALTGDMK